MPPVDRRVLPLDVVGLTERGRPITPVRPPDGAPNVVVVVIDDMGFGASSAYGGPCRMPTTERLAGGGLRYSRFHVTSLCSPTRQALMTGRNHHSVGMGVTTEMATSEPGYTGFRPADAATMAQILGGNGYATGAFGKWHQTPPVEISPSGPFSRWPTGEGFDHFYGFMGAEMNHWYPQLYSGTTPIEPARRPEQGYHLSEDLVEHAMMWISAEQSVTPDQPFFCYLAFGATHAPFHVGPDWIERYAGAFDQGWDVEREQILGRQRELGLVGPDTELSPWAAGVPHWDELDETQRKVAVRLMETYAGFAEHTDAQVGRLVEALERLEVLDDTMIVFLLGDNGASGEGGPAGTLREHLVGHGFADDPGWMAGRLDRIGTAETYAIYPVGWALAMNTPYQWTKQVASHYGGTRDGLIVHWPNGFAARGEIRHQWHHVIDVLPTVLEAVGLPQPTSVQGIDQLPIEGISFGYSFEAADAPEQRSTQYFEMVGNRGIYHQGWTAVTQHGVPWLMTSAARDFTDDVWELYDTTQDWSQAHDLAAQHPDRLAELRALFDVEAARHQVFPLDDRVTERENPQLAGRIDLHAGRTSMAFGPDAGRLSEEAAPNVKNRSHTITVELTIGRQSAAAADQPTGVLCAQGGRFGGWSLYLHQGRLSYAYNCYGRDLTVVRADSALAAGDHQVQVRFDYHGGPAGDGADVAILVGGEVVGHGVLSATTAFYFSFDETFNVGIDRGTPVVDDYPVLDNRFTGMIRSVRFDLAPDEPPPTDPALARQAALRRFD